MSNVKATNAAVLKKLNGAAVHAIAAADDAKDALSAKLAAARKEAKAFRAERDAEAARAQAALEELAALKAAEPNPEHAAAERLSSALDDMLSQFEAPSWKRVLCAATLAIVVSAGTGWCIGWLINMLVAGALMYTGSVFLGMCIMIVGLVLSMVTGMITGSKAFSYVASATIDKHASNAVSKVKGWFGRAEIVEFTGAHTVGAA